MVFKNKKKNLDKQKGGNIDKLNEDVILEILKKLETIEDLTNYCKTNRGIMDICKRNKNIICKNLLEKYDYKTTSGQNFCKILIDLVEMKILKRGDFKVTHFRKMLTKRMSDVIKFLEHNNMIPDSWKYKVAITYINSNKLKNLKDLHEFTGYDFRTRDKGEQLLLSIAESVAFSNKDYKILEYMLEINNGINLDDQDKSEKWHNVPKMTDQYPYLNAKTGLKARDLLLYGVNDPEHRKNMVNIIKKYEK